VAEMIVAGISAGDMQVKWLYISRIGSVLISPSVVLKPGFVI
jgi:hypothetical protein